MLHFKLLYILTQTLLKPVFLDQAAEAVTVIFTIGVYLNQLQ